MEFLGRSDGEKYKDPLSQMPKDSLSKKIKATPDDKTQRCIQIAAKVINDPNLKLSGEDLAFMRAHKKELKSNIPNLQTRERDLDKKALNLVKNVLNLDSHKQSKLDQVKSDYEATKMAYKLIIDSNPSAAQAKKVQTLLKNANSRLQGADNNWKLVDAEFRSRFNSEAKLLGHFGKLNALIGPKTDEKLKQKDAFIEQLVDSLEEVRCNEALKNRPISWLHGTRSPALAVMLATDKTMHPTGKLLERNIIPLSGELGTGIIAGGVNQENISGTSVSKLGIATTLNYSSKYKVSVANEWERVSINNLDGLLKYAELTLKTNPNLEGEFGDRVKLFWLQVGLYAERLKVLDPDFADKIVEVGAYLDKVIEEKKEDPEQLSILNLLTDLRLKFDTPPFIEPTESIRESVLDSFPIILAASNITKTKIAEDMDEHIVKGSISLENISVAFTPSENVLRLRELIDQAGLKIEVMDLKSLQTIAITAPEKSPQIQDI